MRKWLRKWLGIDSLGNAFRAGFHRFYPLSKRMDMLEKEMQIRLDENRFLSRKLDMLSQGVVPPAPEIIKGQDEAQEC